VQIYLPSVWNNYFAENNKLLDKFTSVFFRVLENKNVFIFSFCPDFGSPGKYDAAVAGGEGLLQTRM